MKRYLIYNFPGEIDDLSHLFPNEKLAQIASIIKSQGAKVEIWDRGDIYTIKRLAPTLFKRQVASFLGAYVFRSISKNRPLNTIEKVLFALPLKHISDSMAKDMESHCSDFIKKEAELILAQKFSCIFLNLWRSGFRHSMELAGLIKDNSTVPVYAMGQRVDWFKGDILKLYPQLNGLILGLGYESIKKIILQEIPDTIPNLIIKDKSGNIVSTPAAVSDVNNLPFPVYDDEVYKGIKGFLPLIHLSLSNQACPNNCTFCVRPESYGHKVIRRDIARIADEIEDLMENHRIRCFRIADSTPPPTALTQLAEEILKRGLQDKNIHFTAFARIDANKRENFSLLCKAHFDALFFGIETLDDENLIKVNKGIKYEEIKGTLKAAHENGIFIIASFIYPLPEETERSKNINFTRLKEIAPYLNSVLVTPAGVYPTSEWGKNPQKYSILLDQDYIAKVIHYPVKYIIPMRFWPPFPFRYAIMGKRADQVRFEDILKEFTDFSRQVWKDLNLLDIQDYGLSVAKMLNEDPYKFTNRIKEILVTRNYNELQKIVERTWANSLK